MCQIIATEMKNSEAQYFLNYYKKVLETSLKDKGGDTFSLTWIYEPLFSIEDKLNITMIQAEDVDNLISHFNDEYQIALNKYSKIGYEFLDRKCQLILFSRQIPEMENIQDSGAPYFDKFPDPNTLVWMHGTISNDKELAKEKNIEIKVDSEILLYLDNQEIQEKTKGIFTYLKLNNLQYKHLPVLQLINQGLGGYEYPFNIFGTTIIIQTTDPDFGKIQEDIFEQPYFSKKHIFNKSFYNEMIWEKPLYIAYSGGMDISLNAYKIIKDSESKLIRLFYFDYGSRATDEEIHSLEKFKELISKDFPDKKIETEVIDFHETINNFANLFGNKLKLLDSKAKGSVEETEENHSYIPYRNSLFMLAMGTLADKYKEEPNFVLGLNITEGMIFGDNATVWLEPMQHVVRYGGKQYKDSFILSPYKNKTKTNTLKLFKEEFGEDKLIEILDISFSCYYPKEGKPCGECGSCILRQKALQRI